MCNHCSLEGKTASVDWSEITPASVEKWLHQFLPPGVWIYNAGKTDYHDRFRKRAVIFFLPEGDVTSLFCYQLAVAEQQGLFSLRQEVSILSGLWLRCYELIQLPRNQLGYNCHWALEQRHFNFFFFLNPRNQKALI